jgi:hypothetical protein
MDGSATMVAFKSALGKSVVVFGLLTAQVGWAGPPFVTDDPEIPPPGGWEINIPFILERTRSTTDMNAPLFDINYGLPHVQLKVEVPVEVVHKNGDGTDAGIGDILPGVKWVFLDEQGWRPMLAIYPQIELPTGDHRRGLGEGKPAYILPILAEKNWGKWTVYGNVGYVVQTADGERNYWYEGVSVNREVNERLELGAELFGNSPITSEGRSDIAFNLGGTWKMSEHLNLLFSAGRSISGDIDFMTYVGVQIVTGQAK